MTTQAPTPHAGVEVGSRWQVNGRGDEGGFYVVLQSAVASPLVEIESERSGRRQSIDVASLRANFTRQA